jgi:hypothetical protein
LQVETSTTEHPYENVCHDTRKAAAAGTVASVGGKQMLTATKIELAK